MEKSTWAGLTEEERRAAIRMELYLTHKARGSLGTYYYLYPEDRPKSLSRDPRDQGQERER